MDLETMIVQPDGLITNQQIERRSGKEYVKHLIIESVNATDTATKVTGTNGMKVNLRPFLYLHPGDVLEFNPSIQLFNEVNKVVADNATGKWRRFRIHPPYNVTELIQVPPHAFKITFRERESGKDWRAAKFLEQFHYRGKGLNRIVGRRVVLLIDSEIHGIIGYGVLSSTVAAAKPRFSLFNTNFTKQMRTKLINQLIRIPRIVVHPEFRGIGLGTLMAKHLCRYAKEYWDIRGYAPIMVEVVAAMMDYHHFFELAGFINIGYTLGYDKGIIPQYGKGSWEKRNPERYDFFASMEPKPFLVYPLNEETKKLIEERFPARVPQKSFLGRELKLSRPLRFDRVSVRYKASDGFTKRAYAVQEIFGVDKYQMFSTVLRNFSLTIRPGDVVLITGASGSGKSTVIKLLTRQHKALTKEMRVSGRLIGHDIRRVAVLSTKLKSRWPLIDQVGQDLHEAIQLLNGVGLAEAHLYLKRPRQISEGQKYRFAVAKLCDSRKPLWIADEFASTLDLETSAILAKGLRKIAWKCGVTLVLAASHIDGFAKSLLPNKIVELRWGEITRIYCLKLRRKQDHEVISLWIENQGQAELTELELGGIDLTGKLIPLQRYDLLKAGERTKQAEIKIDDLMECTAIVARAGCGVGDIIYLSLRPSELPKTLTKRF